MRSKVPRLENVDSITLYAHKLGFLLYPNGAFVFRSSGHSYQIEYEALYLESLAPTLGGSRSGGGSSALWVLKEIIGCTGIASIIDHLPDFTNALASCMGAAGDFQVLYQVVLNVVAITPRPFNGEGRKDINALVPRIREQIKSQGEFLLNFDKSLAGVIFRNNHKLHEASSTLVDIEALHLVVANPLVQKQDTALLADRLHHLLRKERCNR